MRGVAFSLAVLTSILFLACTHEGKMGAADRRMSGSLGVRAAAAAPDPAGDEEPAPRYEEYSWEEPAPEVFATWRAFHDYYALLEIVDAYIDPFCNNASKADVLKYLGDTHDPEYPNAGPKMWVFSSVRRVPYGSYLVIRFDDNDAVKEVFWVSE